MAKEYIERETAKMAVVEDLGKGHSPFNAIAMLPAADVVPVVRCRDCEFWERDRITCEGVARCRTGECGVRFRAEHDYCSRGILKRKDGDA